MQTLRARHIDTNERINLSIVEGRMEKIDRPDEEDLHQPDAAFSETFIPVVAPGLIDLQVNGYKGIDFNDQALDEHRISSIVKLLLQQGVTSFYPTIITNDPAFIKQQLRTIRSACENSSLIGSCIAGMHLEGPFISPIDGPRGAHDRRFVLAPDQLLMQEFIEASGEMIKILTLSPEWPEASTFTHWCVQQGITVSIGHTAADSEEILRVTEAGAGMSTHLGNAAHQLLPRHPNYIWDQLANDSLSAGFIGDGFHLPDSVIKTILRMKGDRAILVSDSVALAGQPPGVYTTPVGGSVVLNEDGRLSLADTPAALAGSAQTLFEGVKTLVRKGICNLSAAWKLASMNAAREMHLPYTFQPGSPADFVLLDDRKEISILATYKNGKEI